MKAAHLARRAAAGVPRMLGAPIKYTVTQSLILDSASKLTKITLTGGSNTGTATTDTTAPVPGGQAAHIRFTGSGVNSSTWAWTPGSPIDFTNSFLRFLIRCELYSKARSIEVRFATTSTSYNAGNYLRYQAKAKPSDSSMGNWYVPNTWCWDSIAPVSPVTTAGTGATVSSIGYIVIGFGEVSGQTCLFDLAQLQVVTNASSKAKCVIWHDDGPQTGWTPMYTKMLAKGFPFCEAAEWENIGAGAGSGQITNTDIANGVALGVQFGTHATTAAEHIAQTAQQFENQALRSRVAATRMGWSQSGGQQDFTYWGGLASDVAYPAVQRIYRSGRWNTNVLQWADTLPPADPHLMKALLVTEGTDTFTTNWQPYLNAAVANKGIAQFVFHQGLAGTTLATEFDSMLTWLAANTASIDVVTLNTALAVCT